MKFLRLWVGGEGGVKTFPQGQGNGRAKNEQVISIWWGGGGLLFMNEASLWTRLYFKHTHRLSKECTTFPYLALNSTYDIFQKKNCMKTNKKYFTFKKFGVKFESYHK